MSTAYRLAVVVIAALLLIGCTGRSGATWTFSPDADASAPTAPDQSPGATGQPTDAPADVIPALTPKAELQPVPAGEVNAAYAPDVPPATTRTEQAIVEVQFDIVEGVQAIDPNGLEYTTWGYRLRGDSTVTTGTPGPIVRARVGDVLRFSLTNLPENSMPHNVDFHAVTGQGGGAADLTVAPGETAVIEGRLLYPGMFMYHCAAGDVPEHIARGMYGGILVDPVEPLAPVEHELYMVQSEYYTTDSSDGGPLTTDRQAITDEDPEFVVFNGAVGSLTGDNAPTMRVGESMRIYFVNAGLNLISSFHPIGSHWDKVWAEGALYNEPLRGSQTTLVPAGGGTVVELIAQVPMTVVLVDHALARAFDKGAIGQIIITGEANPELFEAFPITGSPAPLPSATPTEPAASPTEPADGSPSPTPDGTASTGQNISIVPGAYNFQPDGAADEFAETEVPADYSVNELMIPVGTTVTWSNDDPGMVHTVTAADGSFDSGNMAEGDTFSYTFDTPGEFEYLCTPHPWMRARIVVMMH
jgi:nitrite reductase (NO-forming)